MKLPNTFHAKSHTLWLNKGFTLIEVLVVLGVFILLAGATAILSLNSINRSTVSSERDLIVQMLLGARARALANVDQMRQGVYIDSSNIIAFEGDTYPGVNQRSTPRNSAITVSPSPTTLVFDRLSGSAYSGAGTVTLTQSGQSYTIDINSEGRIEW